MKEEVSKHQETLSPADLWGEFWNLRGHHNREEKKTQNTCLTATPQRRSSPDARVCHQRAGAGQGGAGCMLRVRTGPEGPEDNLRQLM